MEAIRISLFGKFEMMVDGSDALRALGNSRKGRLMLIYLILNSNKPISTADLYEALWPDEVSTNPESALKTLVSRVRAALMKFDERLSDCILTSRGAYQWNNEMDCWIDIAEFERLCGEIEASEELNDEVDDKFSRVMNVYTGGLLGTSGNESWIVSRDAYFHMLYLGAVYQMIKLYKEQARHDDIIRACRRALDIDAFDETLHLELMEALVKSDRNNEALTQYRYATDLHYNYLGIRPSEKLQNFYKQLIQADQTINMDINSIRKLLLSGDEKRGAFVCEYAIFKDIYQLQARNLSRLNTKIYLAVVMLSASGENNIDPIELDHMMTQLLTAMVSSLRKGDTITRYSSFQYALLLPSVNYETGRMVMERIKRAYYQVQPNSTYVLSYKLAPVLED